MTEENKTPEAATTAATVSTEEQALNKMFELTNSIHAALAPLASHCDKEGVNPVLFAMALGQVHASFIAHMPGSIHRNFEHALRAMGTAVEFICKNDPNLPDDIKINILAVHNGGDKK